MIIDNVKLCMKILVPGIANRMIRPTLGIVDPENIVTMPERVTAYSGFDVLCHAIESYTALPYTERGAAPTNPKLRPAYQVSLPNECTH